MDWKAPAIACVLFCFAFFVQVLFWVYVGAGIFLLGAALARDHFSKGRKSQFQPLVLSAAGRMRRLARRAEAQSSRFWRLLPSSRIIVCFIAVSVAALLVGAAIGANILRFRNVGTIRAYGVQVYADSGLTQVLTEISWGILDPGEARNFDAWVKNTGNSPQKLVMWTEAWEPLAAQDSLCLSWSYIDEWIPAGSSIPVTFTLTVDSEISGVASFVFDVVIQGVS